MSDIDGLDFPTPEFDENGEIVEQPDVDPATTAQLDQEQQAFADHRAAFRSAYGFDHDCHCAEDYSKGNTEAVTQCFLGMAQDALTRCAQATYEIHMLNLYLSEMLKMTQDLAKMLEDLGHTDELEKYFNETLELEEEDGTSEIEQLVLDLTNEEEEKDDDDGGEVFA